METLHYTVAKDKSGRIIKAYDADKGEDYFCCVCNSQLILKKSVARRRKPHFAHKAHVNCSPETALHHAFKTLLHEKINYHLERGLSMHMEWQCAYCGKKHVGNLLKETRLSRLETDLDNARPDITLLDQKGKAIVAIEIVVTHYPEEKTLEYLTREGIILVRFDIKDLEDLKKIDENPLFPSSVLCCSTSRRCENCNSFTETHNAYIASGFCHHCHEPVRVICIKRHRLESEDGKELTFFQSDGTLIRKKILLRHGEQYVNVCPSCNNILTPWLVIGPMTNEENMTIYHCPQCKLNMPKS